MKKILIVTAVLLAGCSAKKESQEGKTLNNQPPKELNEAEVSIGVVLAENNTSYFPFGLEFDLDKFKLDSTNNYRAGDCWGTVYQYSQNET